jgi:hypothetical protein
MVVWKPSQATCSAVFQISIAFFLSYNSSPQPSSMPGHYHTEAPSLGCSIHKNCFLEPLVDCSPLAINSVHNVLPVEKYIIFPSE